MQNNSKHKGADKLLDNKELMKDLRLISKVFNTPSGLKLLLKWRRDFVEEPKFDPKSVRITDFKLGKEDFVLGIMKDIDNLERLEGYAQSKLDAIEKGEKEEIEEIEIEEEVPEKHSRMDGGLGSNIPQGKG